MHQIKIFHIFVPNLGEIFQFGRKQRFQWNCGPFKAMTAKKKLFSGYKGHLFGVSLVFKGLLPKLYSTRFNYYYYFFYFVFQFLLSFFF